MKSQQYISIIIKWVLCINYVVIKSHDNIMTIGMKLVPHVLNSFEISCIICFNILI